MAVAKSLVREVPSMSLERARDYTARCIANLRASEEGQEGMKAFLEKRPPRWAADSGNNP